MATIYDAIGGYLLSYAGLTALVDQAIFPVRTEQDYAYQNQDAKPYVHYEVTREPIQTLDGVVANEGRLRITAFANNPDDAEEISDQLRAALNIIGAASTTPKIYHALEVTGDDEDDEVFGLFGKRSEYTLLFAAS